MIEDNPLWAFSLKAYSDKQVEILLLELQDQFSADINMILACLWLASTRCQLTQAQCQRLQQASLGWQQDCVTPIRHVRRKLRHRDDAQAMYQRVKELELEAERWQQDLLYKLLANNSEHQLDEAPQELALRYLKFYSEALKEGCWHNMSTGFSALVTVIKW